MKTLTFWQRVGRAARDRSFIIGAVLVAFFVLVAVLGPEAAPHNPYLRDRVQTIDGELRRAPIPPCDLYPLGTDSEGRDLLSLMLHGARQTLTIAFVAMTARLLLGLLLGALSGWWPGSLFDRMITGLTEFLAAIPGLVLAILLIFAVGIRKGQISFVVALSLVGWGEVAQIVRGYVLSMRNKLYILAARALGLAAPQVLSRHVLPNLLDTLLSLASLEMAGVLLLLGELGFVQVFIGGGGLYTSDAVSFGQMIYYFDVPDWGAMLGTSWHYFRSRPWLPLAPALAFFVAILGFNLFGYGLQRFVEKGRFHPSGWSVFCFLVVTTLVLFGSRALLTSTGIEAQYADMAGQFNAQRAWDDASYLIQSAHDPPLESACQPASRPTGLARAQPELEERTLAGGGFRAANYIGTQFKRTDLTPMPRGGYFQQYVTTCGRVTIEPALEILGPDGRPRARLDAGISFDPWQHFEVAGSREGELSIQGNLPGGLLPNGITLLLDPEQILHAPHGYRPPDNTVILRLVPDDELGRNDAAPAFNHFSRLAPFFHLLIGESAARQMLAEAGLDLDELQAALEAGERIDVQTVLRVRVEAGLAYKETPAVNVVGYIPAADRLVEGERILVTAAYNGPSSQDEQVCPGTEGGNAGGVAVMLEVARLWRDLGFEPKRTVIFVAFDRGGGEHFVHHPIFPTGMSDTWTVISLQDLGLGGPRLSRREAGNGLARVFDQSARRFGVRTEELDEWRFFFTSGAPRAGYVSSDPFYSGLAIVRRRDDPLVTPTPTPVLVPASDASDGVANPDLVLLAEAGRTVAHYLMVLGSR
ncbi:MAG: hypothetical protein B6I35_10435 [Anaerolineaceae bacterium 4572_32.2]|nr:MAG: hypothetical protein B6I35_10435 [Anaerolineaceae bacterium 4572_32.2]HEY71957.1 ABC transporter permease subunit [Thermoflexia bacterium]